MYVAESNHYGGTQNFEISAFVLTSQQAGVSDNHVGPRRSRVSGKMKDLPLSRQKPSARRLQFHEVNTNMITWVFKKIEEFQANIYVRRGDLLPRGSVSYPRVRTSSLSGTISKILQNKAKNG